MDVRCEGCNTDYEFDDALVSGRGTRVRCTTCGRSFRVAPSEPAAGEDFWRVLTGDGRTLLFSSLRAIREAIDAGEIEQGDHLARGGGPLRAIGQIPELAVYFEPRTSARALEDAAREAGLSDIPVPLGSVASGSHEGDSHGTSPAIPRPPRTPRAVDPLAEASARTTSPGHAESREEPGPAIAEGHGSRRIKLGLGLAAAILALAAVWSRTVAGGHAEDDGRATPAPGTSMAQAPVPAADPTPAATAPGRRTDVSSSDPAPPTAKEIGILADTGVDADAAVAAPAEESFVEPRTPRRLVEHRGPASRRRAPTLVSDAYAAQARGQYERARVLYEKALVSKPDDPEVLTGLAEILHVRRDLAGARAAYEHVLSLHARYLPAIVGLADLDWEGGQRDVARQRYQGIVDRFPQGTYPPRVEERAADLATRSEAAGPSAPLPREPAVTENGTAE